MSELITVLFGGPSAEHDISILTGLQCERVLAEAGDQVQCVYWDRGGSWHLVPARTEARDYLEGAPKNSVELEMVLAHGTLSLQPVKGMRKRPVDLGVVLLALHGGAGESGGAQSLFAMMDVPATGSSPAAAALGMDKYAFGALMAEVGLPSLPRRLVVAGWQPDFEPPYIVKPRFGGSSIGIEVVDDYATAVALTTTSPYLREGAVIEPYRKDLFDLNISFVTFPEFATSLVEKPTRSATTAIYDYSNKYMAADGLTNAPRELPAQVPDSVTQAMQDACLRVQQGTGLEGVCRVDFLCDGEKVYVNEVNSIPGAMALYLWPEVPPAELLHGMVDQAKQRLAQGASETFENGAALRAAGGISGKLAGLGPRAR